MIDLMYLVPKGKIVNTTMVSKTRFHEVIYGCKLELILRVVVNTISETLPKPLYFIECNFYESSLNLNFD